jgi:glycine/serine hydroxymethyltransferase
MGEPEMEEISSLIATVLRKPDDDTIANDVRDAAARLCSKYTPYPELADAYLNRE